MTLWYPRSGSRFEPLSAKLKPLVGEAALKALKASKKPFKTFRRYSEPKVFGRIGNLEVRLVRSRAEIKLAQRLRYQVFYEEMSATPSKLAQFKRRDEDAFDAICDHLIVVDLDETAKRRKAGRDPLPKVIGTYRVLRQDVADRYSGFYSDAEFDVKSLVARHASTHRFLELGRSCVLAPYRSKRTVELLWHGLWTYVREHGIDVMIGCASFEGVDPPAHAAAFSYLSAHHRAPPEWSCRAHAHCYESMDLLPADQINPKAALKGIPPLIKGYLRLGAYIGDGAVIDHQFGTTDVLIVMPVEKIDPRYFQHYGTPDETCSRVASTD